MNWDKMTYDEQRALLGLPDVRAQVAWMRLGVAARVMARTFGVAFEQIRSNLGQIRPTVERMQQDFALANGDPL